MRTQNRVDTVVLPHLPTFTLAAELGNFTATARALRVSQAAISQRIQLLERLLGVSLFYRQGGKLSLTDAGRKLHDYAQRLLELHAEALQTITGQVTPIVGDLSLAASSIPGEHLLPALIAGFRPLFPQIRIRVLVGDSHSVLIQVERGEVTIGLVGQKSVRPHLKYRFLTQDQILLLVPPGHPLCRRRRVSLRQLEAWPLIIREEGSGLRHCFEQSLLRAGKSLANFSIAMELGSNEAVKESVLQGVGVAFLSAYCVQKELSAGQLQPVTVEGFECDRDIFIVTDERRALPAPAQRFLHYLESHPPHPAI